MFTSIIALIIVIAIINKFLGKVGTVNLNNEEEEPHFPLPSKTVPTFSFRPTNFNEYIGQEKSKDILKQYIIAIKERNIVFPHLLIHGKAGMGKTTLARILAKELDVPFVEYITSEIYLFTDIINLITKAEGGILFLDEIHALDRNNAEKMYSVMEDFLFNGQPIPSFTLVGATTELGEILKKRKPFYDRFKIILELEDYTEKELITIAKQYREKIFYMDKELDDEVYVLLAKNCRATPRHLIRLLEATIYFHSDIHSVFRNFNILQDGFTTKDLLILKYINQNEKGVGLQGLVSYLDTSTANYLYEIEPFLLKKGLILRTPRGRKITQMGQDFIKVLSTTVS